MVTLVSVVSRYATWLFILLGALALRQVWQLVQGLGHRRSSLFRLEKESASAKVQRAGVSLLLYLTLAMGVRTIAYQVAPSLGPELLSGGHSPPLVQEPPTADLPTDTPTAPPYSATPPPLVIITSTPPAP